VTGASGVLRAELVGGPMDGHVQLLDGPAGGAASRVVVRGDGDALDVVLADGSRHRYNRVGCLVPDADGAVPFEWSGRLS
jgi:hypothetical protein